MHLERASRTSAYQALALEVIKHRKDLLRMARAAVGANDAEDLIQSTLEKALANLKSFRTGTNMFAWLRRIMTNLMVDEWRHRRRWRLVDFDVVDVVGPTEEPTSEWERLSGTDVAQAVPRLPPHLRSVFDLARQGYSYQQISTNLNLQIRTVGTRLLRARRQLRRYLVAELERRDERPGNESRSDATSQALPCRHRTPEVASSRGGAVQGTLGTLLLQALAAGRGSSVDTSSIPSFMAPALDALIAQLHRDASTTWQPVQLESGVYAQHLATCVAGAGTDPLRSIAYLCNRSLPRLRPRTRSPGLIIASANSSTTRSPVPHGPSIRIRRSWMRFASAAPKLTLGGGEDHSVTPKILRAGPRTIAAWVSVAARRTALGLIRAENTRRRITDRAAGGTAAVRAGSRASLPEGPLSQRLQGGPGLGHRSAVEKATPNRHQAPARSVA